MIVQCVKLSTVDKAIFFWEETLKQKDEFGNTKVKRFKAASEGETFEVGDECGHDLLAAYKGTLVLVQYGSLPPKESLGPQKEEEVTKKATSSPRTAMVKEEKDK